MTDIKELASMGRVTVEYDGFVGTVIGSYVTREGKRGVVVQQDGTRVVHVYGEARVRQTAALDSPPDHGGGEGWQSIETAPKNRKVLAAYRNPLGNWRIVTACYHTELPWSDDAGWDSDSEFAPEAWYEESDSQDSILPTASLPTHWQPLPAPPALRSQP